VVKSGRDKGWKNEMTAFMRALHESGQPPIPYEQLLGVAKATFEVVESLRGARANE
jgi:hypothetical protein